MIEITKSIYIIEIKFQPKTKHFKTIVELFCKFSLETFIGRIQLKLKSLLRQEDLSRLSINCYETIDYVISRLILRSCHLFKIILKQSILYCLYQSIPVNWTVVEILTAWTKSWQVSIQLYLLFEPVNNFLNFDT